MMMTDWLIDWLSVKIIKRKKISIQQVHDQTQNKTKLYKIHDDNNVAKKLKR
jgi:hypothetical protein